MDVGCAVCAVQSPASIRNPARPGRHPIDGKATVSTAGNLHWGGRQPWLRGWRMADADGTASHPWLANTTRPILSGQLVG